MGGLRENHVLSGVFPVINSQGQDGMPILTLSTNFQEALEPCIDMECI